MPHIFVSHATTDDPKVTEIQQALEAAGIPTWVDHLKGIVPGDNWARQIQDAANTCDAALFVLSPASAKSDYCEAEWNRILSLGKRLYIVMLENVPLMDMPLRLGTIQYANLTKDWAGGLQTLIQAIQQKQDLDPKVPIVQRITRISGTFPRWQLDLPLIGRESELKTLGHLLADPPGRAAVLGLGGVGKTRLAAEIAISGNYKGGVVWHTITPQSTVSELTLLIRDHLNLIQTTPDDAIWTEAGKQAVLLILDNAEDCAQPTAYAARLNALDTSSGTRLLMTSRAVWRELKHVKSLDLRAPTLDAAVAILKAMAALEPPAFPADGHERDLAQAARQHPRLIQYAVRWLDSYPPDYVLTTLNTLGGADAAEALDEMVRKTVTQVRTRPDGEAAIAALQRLAVTRGGFTFAAALAIMPSDENPDNALDYPRCLALLKQWGLVTLEGQRYTIDPLVTAAVGEDASAHHAHYVYYHALAWQHDEKQDYLGLDPESANLEAAFEWAFRVQDMVGALNLANACVKFFGNRGRFRQRLDWFEWLENMLDEHPDRMLWANAQNSLGEAYREYPLGNRLGNLKRAVAAFEQALQFYTTEAAPLDYAMTQNNQGNVYWNLAGLEDQMGNLKRAVDAYEQALRFRTAEATPLDYAMTQNNLGVAYSDLAGVENQADNLKRAVAAYEQALRFYTAEAVPLNYAATQNNLGIAYRDLAGLEDQAGNLKRAVAAYEQALRFCTAEAAPLDYAMTQNNLGIAYRALAGVEDPASNLKRAVAAFEQALRFRTAEVVPLNYAATQNNLGAAYADLAGLEDQAGNLKRAVAAYEQALCFRTAEAAPLDYATTQRNLGDVYKYLSKLDKAVIYWHEAEKYWRLMGMENWANWMLGVIEEAEGKSDSQM